MRRQDFHFGETKLVWKGKAPGRGTAGTVLSHQGVNKPHATLEDEADAPALTPAQLAEELERDKTRERAGQAQQRVSEVALARLSREQQERKCDPETPHLINAIDPAALEVDERNLIAVESVAVVLMMHLIGQKQIDDNGLSSIESVRTWKDKLPNLDPRPLQSGPEWAFVNKVSS